MYIWPDGKSYSGRWQNGCQHGFGIITYPDNTTKKGEWNEGKRIRWITSQ